MSKEDLPEDKDLKEEPEDTKEDKVDQGKEPEQEPKQKDTPVMTDKGEPSEDTEPEDDGKDDEIEALKTKLAEAQEYKEKYEQANEFKEKYEDTQKELEGYEASLDKIAEERIEAIPEEFRELVPEGTTQEKLDWLAKAEESGVFKVKEEKSIGSSSRANDQESKKIEQKDMTANQKLVTGITDFFKGSKA